MRPRKGAIARLDFAGTPLPTESGGRGRGDRGRGESLILAEIASQLAAGEGNFDFPSSVLPGKNLFTLGNRAYNLLREGGGGRTLETGFLAVVEERVIHSLAAIDARVESVAVERQCC